MPEKTPIARMKEDILQQRGRTLPEEFERVLNLVKVLREECPWDRKQTPESL
ncbi:MAG: nucleoside triphosphate pyrophosphohydrolase, partial [Chlorobiaceae bacterium]|nr:nucleoside triphosphate pyrophosphohydrolase [Chlorobiaceae bacterium]